MKKYFFWALTHILIVGFSGTFVLSVMYCFIDLNFWTITNTYAGASVGSLAVDMFKWLKKRRTEQLREDVVEVINQIYDKYANGYNSTEIGYIRTKKWKLPLTPEQETQMRKVLCPK